MDPLIETTPEPYQPLGGSRDPLGDYSALRDSTPVDTCVALPQPFGDA